MAKQNNTERFLDHAQKKQKQRGSDIQPLTRLKESKMLLIRGLNEVCGCQKNTYGHQVAVQVSLSFCHPAAARKPASKENSPLTCWRWQKSTPRVFLSSWSSGTHYFSNNPFSISPYFCSLVLALIQQRYKCHFVLSDFFLQFILLYYEYWPGQELKQQVHVMLQGVVSSVNLCYPLTPQTLILDKVVETWDRCSLMYSFNEY